MRVGRGGPEVRTELPSASWLGANEMKKPPKSKPKKGHPKPPNPLGARDSPDNSKTETESKSSHTQQKEKEKPRSLIWWGWKEFWAFAGPLISVVGLYFLLRPQIIVEPSVNLDPAQTLSTQLIIKNAGRVPVYNVHFGFGLGAYVSTQRLVF